MFRIFRYPLLILLLALSINPAQADSYEFSPSLYKFDYREYSETGVFLDREEGLLPGFKLAVHHERDDLRLSVHGALYSGQIDYIGRTQGGTPHETDTDTELFNLGLGLQGGGLFGSPLRPFIGARYWRWDRDIQTAFNAEIGDFVGGLHEIYRWYELELGLGYERMTDTGSVLNMRLSALYIVDPTMDIRLPNSTPTLDLGSKGGFRLSAGRTWRLASSHTGADASIGIHLFTEFWEFGRSDPVFTNDFFGSSAYLTEPDSDSFHTGVELRLLSHF